MTQALDYAPAPTRPSPRGVLLRIAYYACWPLGMVVPAMFGIIALLESGLLGPAHDEYFVLAPAVGVAAGICLAHLFRHRRRPHVTVVALGVLTFLGGAVMTAVAWAGPRGFLWELGLILAGGLAASGLVLFSAGAAGLRLNRPAAA